MMNNLQIRYFLHLGKTGNISLAARQLYVAQPAVSKQISALEKELGICLFHRTNRGVALTKEGQALFDFFTRTSTEYNAILADIKSRPKEVIENINIGILENLESESIKQAAVQLMKRYPQIRVNLRWNDNGTLLEQLAAKEVDAIITFDHAVENHRGIESTVLALVQTLFVISKNHPLAQRSRLNCEDLSGQVFCIPPQEAGTHSDAYLMQTLERLKIQPGGFAQMDNMVSGLAAIELNGLVALLDEWVSLPDRNRYHLIETSIYHNIVAAYLAHNDSPTIPLIVSRLAKCFK